MGATLEGGIKSLDDGSNSLEEDNALQEGE